MKFNREKLKRRRLHERLAEEAMTDLETDDPSWWSVVAWNKPAEWQQMFEGRTVGMPRPHPDIAVRSIMLCEHLNKELHHDGTWMVMLVGRTAFNFAPGYSEYASARVLWLDADADVQFVVHLDDFLSDEALSNDVEVYTDACESAWQQYHTAIHGWIDPTPEQMVVRA